jgi:hypothetical protein
MKTTCELCRLLRAHPSLADEVARLLALPLPTAGPPVPGNQLELVFPEEASPDREP